MKLLSAKDATDSRKKENETLLDENVRLRKLYRETLVALQDAKADYTPEQQKALKEFNEFVKDITQKKSVLLKELKGIQKLINDKKDIYYGLVAKQDVLEERIYQQDERERKLDMRERFVKELEKRTYV